MLFYTQLIPNAATHTHTRVHVHTKLIHQFAYKFFLLKYSKAFGGINLTVTESPDIFQNVAHCINMLSWSQH